MAPIGVMRYPARPSRLLNFNNSSVSHKKITASNAATSPFLTLPAELRCPIYDYVFGSNTVRITSYLHIEPRSRRVGYRVSSCACEYDHTQLSPRVRSYEHETDTERVCTEACEICTVRDTRRTSALESFGLPLLQVCRQIYYEAALKPFQQAFFVFDFEQLNVQKAAYGLPAFMNALIPAQVKAITHLRLLSASLDRLDFAKLPRLEGLKYLEMQLNFSFTDFRDALQQLKDFADDPIVRSLVNFGLKSVRVEVGLDRPDSRDRRWAELLGETLDSVTTDDARFFEEVLKRTETDLLGSR